jgi:hypothetical protein
MRKKSTQQKIIEGRGAHVGTGAMDRLLTAAPKPESGLLPPPANLRGDSKLIYIHFAEQLSIMHLDKRPDAYALALVALALARVWKCDKRMQHDGIIAKVPIREGRGHRRKTVGYRHRRSQWWAIRVESVIRSHVLNGKHKPSSQQVVAADEVIDMVKSYLK